MRLTPFAIALVVAGPAFAQGSSTGGGQSPAPSGSEAGSQASTMGQPRPDADSGNNGVGHAGSLEQDHGKAKSVVTGGSGTPMGGGSSKGTGSVENDPALGGGSQAPK